MALLPAVRCRRNLAMLPALCSAAVPCILGPTLLAPPAPPPLQGYLTGLGGNSLLLSYFATKREANAVVVQVSSRAAPSP